MPALILGAAFAGTVTMMSPLPRILATGTSPSVSEATDRYIDGHDFDGSGSIELGRWTAEPSPVFPPFERGGMWQNYRQRLTDELPEAAADSASIAFSADFWGNHDGVASRDELVTEISMTYDTNRNRMLDDGPGFGDEIAWFEGTQGVNRTSLRR
jgi:hypothetical protein